MPWNSRLPHTAWCVCATPEITYIIVLIFCITPHSLTRSGQTLKDDLP